MDPPALRRTGSSPQHRATAAAQKKTPLNFAPPATASRDDGLVARYEELRRLALGRGGVQAQGLALFIRRGMRAWMQAWSQCVPPSLPASAALSDDPQTCPAQLHAQVATLLANMVLFARQEALT